MTYAIATSKDGGSVEVLLRDYGIADLIPLERVVDRQTFRWGAADEVQLQGTRGAVVDPTRLPGAHRAGS